MRVDHVVVPLVDRQVDGLADGAARVVQERRHVRELDEVAKVLDRPVAAPVVEVAHERRAVGGREDGVRAADLDVVRRVARHLREARRARSPARAGGRGRGESGRARRRCRRPASWNSVSASGVSRKSIPTCSRTVSAFSSISARCSSESTSNGVSVRVMYGTLTAFEIARAACLAARPPLRRPPVISVMPGSFGLDRTAHGARRRRAVGGLGDAAGRQGDDGAQPLVGIGVVRDRHRTDEELLEARLDGRLDLLDAPHDLLDLGARGAVEQRDARAGAGGVAGRGDVGGVAVGHEAEHERVHRVDVVAEGAGEADPVDALDPVALEQQHAARVEGGLRELDLADVVLRDRELAARRRRARTRTCGRRGRSAASARRARRRSCRRW